MIVAKIASLAEFKRAIRERERDKSAPVVLASYYIYQQRDSFAQEEFYNPPQKSCSLSLSLMAWTIAHIWAVPLRSIIYVTQKHFFDQSTNMLLTFCRQIKYTLFSSHLYLMTVDIAYFFCQQVVLIIPLIVTAV